MKVLELFAGSRSFSKVAEEMGMETFTSDFKKFDKIDYVVDILDLMFQKSHLNQILCGVHHLAHISQ